MSCKASTRRVVMYQNVVVTTDRKVLDRIDEQLNLLDLDFLKEMIAVNETPDAGINSVFRYYVQYSVFSSESRKVRKIDPALTEMFRSFMGNGIEVAYVLEKTSEPHTYEGCERAMQAYKEDLGICWSIAI